MQEEYKIIVNVERCAHDLRKGYPIIIESESDKIICFAAETATDKQIKQLENEADNTSKLVISEKRINWILDDSKKHSASKIDLSDYVLDNLVQIAGIDLEENNLDTQIIQNGLEPLDGIDLLALKIVKIAELLPSAIVIKLDNNFKTQDYLTVKSDEISKYADLISYNVEEVCRTPIALSGNADSQIVAFRPNIGGREHYAIIIGNPPDIPLVRIHSSCYTGDLLASLECDCRDQLHGAIDKMSDQGGIILYMLQEGRGIGIINKLRAYSLKAKGKDTVDANQILGFDDDERLFLPAAQILKKLGINKVELLTNNPRKKKGLEEQDIEVAKTVRHIIEPNEHNKEYINTKAQRLGHDIP